MRQRGRSRIIAAVGWAACASTALGRDGPAHFSVVARYAIGGSDVGYDYLRFDGASGRLFVAHGNRVEVLDTRTGEAVGQLDNTPGVHGIALAKTTGHGFTSNGTDRSVTMFDLASLKPLTVIKYTGIKPDAIEVDPDTGHVFVVNGGATGDITVIAPETGAIVGTVSLSGGKLEQLVFDGHGRGFVNDEAQNVVHVFDSRALSPVAKWALGPGDGPTGLALDAVHHRLFSACGNLKLIVLDSDSGAVIAAPAIGSEPDGAAFDSVRGLIYSSNRDGTLTVLHQDTADQYRVVQTVATETGARTLALDEATGRIFLAAAKFGPAPAPTKQTPKPRPPMVPASFVVLVVGQ